MMYIMVLVVVIVVRLWKFCARVFVRSPLWLVSTW